MIVLFYSQISSSSDFSEKIFKMIIIIIIIIIILLLKCFSLQVKLMVFHWILGDNESSQASRTLLIILADFNSAVVWMVLILLLNSNLPSLFTRLLGTVSVAPTTIAITVTFMSHSFFFFSFFFFFFFFFCSLTWSKCFSCFLLSFIFTQLSAGTTKTSRYFLLVD